MSCQVCPEIALLLSYQTATAGAYGCHLTGPIDGAYYRVRTTTYNYVNGSYDVVVTRTGMLLTVEDECEESSVSGQDLGFDYGGFIDSVVVLSDPVSLSAVLAAACSAVDFTGADTETSITWLTRDLWLSEIEDLGVSLASKSGGIDSSCTAVRFKFALAAYTGLPVLLSWDWLTDDGGTPTLTPADPITVTGETDWIYVPVADGETARPYNLKIEVLYA